MNDIIVKPTLKTWKYIVSFYSYYLISNRLHTKIPMTYKIDHYGMTPGINSDIKDFKRPARPTIEGKALVVILDGDSIGIKIAPGMIPIRGSRFNNIHGYHIHQRMPDSNSKNGT